jgi:hypothetical protein
MSDRWQLVTSFLATHVDEWAAFNTATGAAALGPAVTPNEEFFPRSKYWQWNYKVAGSYDLPWEMQLAGTFTSASGDVWGRDARFTTGLVRSGSLILRMEDPAANRLPTQNLLNFRFEKRLKIGGGRAAFQFDLFNVTNTNVELGVTTRSGATFGNVTSIVPPRIVRLGVSYMF